MPFREQFFPSSLYLLKVNNRNTRTGCEVCCVSMVNFEHVITGWVLMKEVTLMEKLEKKKSMTVLIMLTLTRMRTFTLNAVA